MSKKILVTDGMSKTAVNELKNSGYEVIEQYYEDEALGGALKDVDAIVIRSATKVREKHINEALEAGKLKLIIRGGVGIDNIDHKYAEQKGVSVRNTPAASSPSVAELAVAHMFALARFIPVAKMTMSEGKWDKKKYKGIELSGKTLGIIGIGRIGIELANRADALGMNVIYTDIRDDLDVSQSFKRVSFEDVLGKSDFISVHVPISKGQPALIGKKEISGMKDGSYIINCARGGVVDEEALIDALDSGKLAGAGVDVFVEEPTKNIKLASHPKVSVTPHIGAQTGEAQERVGDEVVKIIRGFFE
jgi:D-3-phosphoglycerate dehydrogenase